MEEKRQAQTDEEEVEIIPDDELNPGDTLKKLRDALKICREEKGEYLAGWQRAKADFINAGREREKDIARFSRIKERTILAELLSVIDSFEKAIGTESPTTPWAKGIEHIYKQLTVLLERYGVTTIETTGAEFDPHYHEALEISVVSDKAKDDIITIELQKGYMIGEEVLRPAKVKVGKYIQK